MATFRKPNMSQFNSAMNKLKSANSQFQRESNRAIRELKSLESKAKAEQRKLRTISYPSVVSIGSSNQHVNEIYNFLNEIPTTEQTKQGEIRDVFISYAHEDRTTFVKPLVDELAKRNITRWYDEEQAINNWGHSLREEIDSGIKSSKFCMVVFSKNYFKKYWTKRELDGILMKERIDNGQILPIWHGIDENDMYEFSPMLSSMMAFSTSIYTVDEICDAIESKIRNSTMSE